jgi:hypothetical protein
MSTNTNSPKKSSRTPVVKAQTHSAALRPPARREYKPVGNESSFLALPFVHRPKQESKNASNWCVPKIGDYRQACDIGQEYAAHFAQYLKDNPDMCGANSLGHIAMDIDFMDESDAKGYWVGFFSYLERLIFAQTQWMDVFGDVDRIKACYARRNGKRDIE